MIQMRRIHPRTANDAKQPCRLWVFHEKCTPSSATCLHSSLGLLRIPTSDHRWLPWQVEAHNVDLDRRMPMARSRELAYQVKPAASQLQASCKPLRAIIKSCALEKAPRAEFSGEPAHWDRWTYRPPLSGISLALPSMHDSESA